MVAAVDTVVRVDRFGAQQTDLAQGELASIGSCQCGQCEFDIELPGSLQHVFIQVRAYDDYWRIANCGPYAAILENADQLSEYMTVDATSAWHPVPYEKTRLRDAASNDLVAAVTTLATKLDLAVPPMCPAAQDVAAFPSLSRDTVHFAVLSALCEPRLTQGPGAPLPSSAAIAERITDGGRIITSRAIDSQIDYLLDKLEIRPGDVASPGGGRGWKRELLATEAIRRRIVVKADIAPN